MLENITINTGIFIALTIALVEIAKRAGFPTRYAGVLSVVFGLGFGGVAYFAGDSALTESLISGLVIGLTGAGVYSGTKAVISK